MKHICTTYEKDVYPNKEIFVVEYFDRLTVKAIILDQNGKMALVGNKKNNFLQLPGGGVDNGESMEEGLVRECLEEVECFVEISSEVGYIDDYRSRDKKHNINYCYVVNVLEKKGMPLYTDNESRIGMYTKWVSVDEAFDIFHKQKKDLENGLVEFYNTGFNISRDFLFLKEFMKYQI